MADSAPDRYRTHVGSWLNAKNFTTKASDPNALHEAKLLNLNCDKTLSFSVALSSNSTVKINVHCQFIDRIFFEYRYKCSYLTVLIGNILLNFLVRLLLS